VAYFGDGHFQALKEEEDASVRKPEERLYPLPSSLQRLARILLRIISKMRVHGDAGPFLEPVPDREFPGYKDIVLHPIDLGKISKKAQLLSTSAAATCSMT
jgi:hypothetical protein